LIQVALGAKPESANPELRNLADSTAGAIILDTETGLHLNMSFKEKKTSEQVKGFLTSASSGEREAALDSYPQEDKSLLPTLIQMIRSDASIGVLYRAATRFNSLTKQSFEFWKATDILEWWDKNRASFQ
jgi:hypothetical protein